MIYAFILLSCVTDQLLVLLPEPSEGGPASLSHLRLHDDFDMSYHLNCPGLCGDFQEDIEFRFSLGLASLISRLRGQSRGGLGEFASHVIIYLSFSYSFIYITPHFSLTTGNRPTLPQCGNERCDPL